MKSNTTIRTLASEYSNQIKYIPGYVKDRLGASTMLVRPDGVVAWASDAAARWFGAGKQGN